MASGTCEPNGYCSFDDPECASGRRYGELAGGGLAGLCVNDTPETTGASSSSGPGTTSVNPMTGLTTELTTESGSTSGSSTSETTQGSTSGGESSSSSDGSGSTGGSTLDDGLVVFVDFEDEAEYGKAVELLELAKGAGSEVLGIMKKKGRKIPDTLE